MYRKPLISWIIRLASNFNDTAELSCCASFAPLLSQVSGVKHFADFRFHLCKSCKQLSWHRHNSRFVVFRLVKPDYASFEINLWPLNCARFPDAHTASEQEGD